MTLHILIDTVDEHIVNTHRNPLVGEIRKFIKHFTKEEGRPLARIIVTEGKVKVIQAGEEEIS